MRRKENDGFDRIRELYYQLTKSKKHSFPQIGSIKNLPDRQGVYIIYTPKKRIAHVGRTKHGKKGLLQRLNNHLWNQSSFVRQYLDHRPDKLRKGWTYQYIVVENKYDRIVLEAYGVWRLRPLHLGHEKHKEK